MGLNILAYRVTGVEYDEDYSGRKYPILKTEKYEKFDSARYSGDREFVSSVDFKPHPQDGVDFEERFYRPKDFSVARQWVKDNIIDGNQPRLLTLLEEMEKDESIYLYFSW